MNPSEAREHLEMVERIIAASCQKLEAGGEFFVVWGFASAAMDAIVTAVVAGRLPMAAVWISAVIAVAAVVFTVARARSYRKYGRMSLLQREYLNVLWLAIAVVFVVQFIGFNLFPPLAQVALWSVAETIVLLYIGMHGNRRALIGGFVILASIALANFTPQYSGYILAAGVLAGYAGFGIADLLARE